MKKKIISIIIIIFSFVFIYSSISINDKNIKASQERILNEIYNKDIEEIEEIIPEEGFEPMEQTEQTEQEKTNSFNNKELSIIIVTTVITVLSFFTIIYTIMYLLNAIKFPLTNLTAVLYVLFVVIMSEIIIISTVNYTDKNYINGKNYEKETLKREKAYYVVKDSKKEVNKKYESIKNDETVLKVTNEAEYQATKIDLLKKEGKITKENKNNGINDVVFITNGATLNLSISNIKSNVKSSNAVFASGLNTKLYLENVNIKTEKDNSKAIISTTNSEISVKNSNITTVGKNSPLFESSSNIIVDNVVAKTNSFIASLINTNHLSITNSTFETSLNEEKHGIFNIINKTNNTSYDAAALTIENSTIKVLRTSQFYNTIPMFVVNDENAQINITKNKFIYGSNILLSLIAKESSSPKTTVFTITDSTIKGNIISDKNSKAKININNSTYTGSINSNKESQSIDVTLDKNSTWNLTGESYINIITFQNQKNIRKYINSNGYNIYCNSEANEWLNGRTILLNGGGKLIPVKKTSLS